MKKGERVAFALLVIFQLLLILAVRVGASDGVTWTKYAGNPLNLGVGAVEPWVIRDGLTFKMWYSGGGDVYYATSLDGIDWTPHGVVLESDSSSWDRDTVRNPIVILDVTGYRMWYSGYVDGTAAIGLATSSDGVHWTKYSTNPVLTAGGNGGWDDYTVGAFTIMVEGTKYWMWYNGVGSDGIQKIGVATSLDGVSWTKYSANPVLVPSPGEWDDYHVYTGPVLKREGIYLMWYTGQTWATNRVGLAMSSHGYSWSKYDGNPVLDVGPSGTWDSGYVYATSILEEWGNLHMWYWAYSYEPGGTNQIGLATSALAYPPAPVGGEWAPIETAQAVAPITLLTVAMLAALATGSWRRFKKH